MSDRRTVADRLPIQLRGQLPTDHGGLEVLTFAECLQLMASEPVGRFAFVDAGEPVVLPVNHRLVGRNVVFRTTFGSKLDKAVMETPAVGRDHWVRLHVNEVTGRRILRLELER